MLSELVRLPKIGPNSPRMKFDSIEWGEGPGALQIDISPLGSYKIITRRHIKDLQGETAWICKAVFPLVETEHNVNEIKIAHTIYEQVKKLSGKMVDGPNKMCEDFERLAWKMWAAVRKNHPSYCMFPVSLRKQNENLYKIIFEFRGHGVEAPTRGRVEQFDIDLYWDQKRGLIRCFGYDIISSVGQHDWKVQPSEWDELFSPSQPHEEIIEAVVAAFLTY